VKKSAKTKITKQQQNKKTQQQKQKRTNNNNENNLPKIKYAHDNNQKRNQKQTHHK